ncbi:MAG: tyrosine-type recombinase/integrase [Pseudomonadota bacterium]
MMASREMLFRIVNNFQPDDKSPIIDLILNETPDKAGRAALGFAVGYIFGQKFELADKEAISQLKELHKRVLGNSGLLKSLKPRLRAAGSIFEEDTDLIRIGEKDRGQMDYKEGFLTFCRFHRNLSENTIRSYEFDLRQFFEWLNKNQIEITSITIKNLDAFLIWLKQLGITVSTVNRHMYCLKSFYRWLMRIEAVNRNPLEAFQNARDKKRLPKYLNSEQQEALLLAARNGKYNAPWLGQRNYLIILFLLDTGVRIGELCTLEVGSIDLNEGFAMVIGKGDKEREVVLSDRLKDAIKAYLAMVNASELKGCVGPILASRGFTLRSACKEMDICYKSVRAVLDYGYQGEINRKLQRFVKEKIRPLPIKFLFFNEHGVPVIQRHAFRIVKEIGKRAGIPDLHPHALRHTAATNLRERGAELILIKEALGHSSVSTTEMYAHVGNGRYREEMKRLLNQ